MRAFERNLETSVRRVARALDIPRTTVHRVLQENGLHPFHYERVQQLQRDEAQRMYFCEGIFKFQCFYYIFLGLIIIKIHK